MTIIRSLMLSLLVGAVVAGAAAARDLTNAERDSLATVVKEFQAAVKSKDVGAILAVLPPKIMESLAADAGRSTEDYRANLIRVMSEAMTPIAIERARLDLAAADYREADDGTPYVLVPTEVVADLGAEGRFASEFHTFALLDGGGWRLLQLNDISQVRLFTRLYPGFGNVSLPTGSVKELK